MWNLTNHLQGLPITTLTFRLCSNTATYLIKREYSGGHFDSLHRVVSGSSHACHEELKCDCRLQRCRMCDGKVCQAISLHLLTILLHSIISIKSHKLTYSGRSPGVLGSNYSATWLKSLVIAYQRLCDCSAGLLQTFGVEVLLHLSRNTVRWKHNLTSQRPVFRGRACAQLASTS